MERNASMNDNNNESYEDEGGLALDSVKGLEKEAKREPWYVSTGRSFGRFLAKLAVGILGFLFDAIKGVFTIVFGLFFGIYKAIVGVGKAFRTAHRNFYEIDGYGKASYFAMGLSHFKRKLYIDGIIYLAIEIIFILWFALVGWTSIANLSLSEQVSEEFTNQGNQVPLIQGILSVIVIIAFVIVYSIYLKSVHDIYVIHNEIAFKDANARALYAIENNASFQDVRECKTARGRREVLMRNHGFSRLAARYASYLPWNRLDPKPHGIEALFDEAVRYYDKARAKVYSFYDDLRKKIRLKGLGDLFAHFLEWDLIERKSTRGYSSVRDLANRRYLSFIHTYDKYNDFHSRERTLKSYISVLEQPKAIEDCVYSRDPISQKGGLDAKGGPDMPLVYALRDPSKYIRAAFPEELIGVSRKKKDIQATMNERLAMDGKLCAALSEIFYVANEASKKAKVPGHEPLKDGKIDKAGLYGMDFDAVLKVYLEYYEGRAREYAKKHASENETSPKLIASRIVGLFGCDYKIAVNVARMYLLAKKMGSKPAPANKLPSFTKSGKVNKFALAGKSTLDGLALFLESYRNALSAFEKENADRKASALAKAEIYSRPSEYLAAAKAGRNALLSAIEKDYPNLTDFDLDEVVRDYLWALKEDRKGKDAPSFERIMAMKGKEAETYATLAQEDFHGQLMRFSKKMKTYLDERFAVTVLALPVLGSLVVSIVPLIFSMLIAFTNWDRYTYANRHFVWNPSAWASLFGLGGGDPLFLPTFLELLVWTLVWAVLATFLNYIFGIIVALMINRKGIKLKKMWRTLFVVTIAIPQFITLLCMRNILGSSGPVNTWLLTQGWYTDGVAPALGFTYANGDPKPFPFLGDLANQGSLPYDGTNPFVLAFTRAFWAKVTIVLVNIWVGIPYTMLSTSGILMNIPDDLYESSQIDGASKWRQFWSITMPYILFVTGPSLLTSFIGNINNFNVIYFLTGGGAETTPGLYYKAGNTSLLITWIYKLSTGNQASYNEASVMGCIIFAICGFFSIIAYKRMGSVKNEEEFQ